MKNRLLNFIMILTILFVGCFVLTSCNSYGGAKEPGDYGGDLGYAGGDLGESAPDTYPDEGNDSQIVIKPGQLTACAYDDNEHFTFWKSLTSQSSQFSESTGLFYNYYESFAFKTFNRLVIKVPTNVDAKVHLVDLQKNIVATAIPNANGIAYLYPNTLQETYDICLEYVKTGETDVTTQFEKVVGDTEFVIDGNYTKNDTIQLMFVIDTTGSMGDEINYLKSEVNDIISKVKNEFGNSTIELAIMLYRDLQDQYVTKYSDFNTDIAAQQSFLSKQYADGGGDFPEAVDTAMYEAAEKQWSEKAKTKILVHVADAPAHDYSVSKWEFATKVLASKGVRIITVSSSGIDKKTEYLFRSQCIITGGKYVYLTNDSGIGNSHIDATVEVKPTVEYLNSCLVRLIKGYHTGTFEEPIYYGQEQ